MVFTIVHEEGFAVLENSNNAYAVARVNRKVNIKMFGAVEDGYVYCCSQYVKRWLDAGYKTVVPLPSLDMLLKGGGCYINPLFPKMIDIAERVHPNKIPKRFFSVVTPFGFGYFDMVCNIFSIIDQFDGHYLQAQEFVFLDEAKSYAVHAYIWQQMSMGAYLTDSIQVPENLAVNEFFCAERQLLIPQLPWGNSLLGTL